MQSAHMVEAQSQVKMSMLQTRLFRTAAIPRKLWPWLRSDRTSAKAACSAGSCSKCRESAPRRHPKAIFPTRWPCARLWPNASRVRSPIASRSHWLTAPMMVITSLPAAEPYGRRLWWCFAKPGVRQDGEGSYRETVNDWHDADIHGETLSTEKLSGNLLKVQAFRGTICEVIAFDYLRRKKLAAIGQAP
jgi:hypothetical protein